MNKDLKKTLFFSVIVFVFSCFVIFEINKLKNEEDVEEIKNKVVAVETNKIQTIVLGNNSQIEKVDTHYLIKSEDLNDLLSTRSVESWLSSALSLEGRKLSNEDEAVDWKKFQFSDSNQKISLFTEQRAIELTLSPMRSFDGGVYLKVTDNKKDYLYSSGKEWVDFFDKNVNLLRETKLFDWTVIDPESKPVKFDVKTKKGSYSLEKKDNTWQPVTDRMNEWMIDGAKVESYFSDVKSFLINDFSDETVDVKNPIYSLTVFTDKDESQYTLNVYEQNNSMLAKVSYRPGSVFGSGNENTFTVSGENIKSLFPDAVDFKDFKTDLSFEEPKVKKLNVEKDKINLKFYKDINNNSWHLTKATSENKLNPEPEEFNSSSVLKVIDTLKGLKPERYLDESPKSMGKVEASFMFLDENDQIVKGLKLFPDKTSCIKGQSESKDCKLIQVDKSFLLVKENEISKLTSIDYFKNKNKDTSVE